MPWQAILDESNRVVTVNNWEHPVGIPCAPDTPMGYEWTGTEFVRPISDITQELLAAVQQHLDATVRTRGYDSMLSCCSYVSSTDPTFSAEALDAAAWRDAVWRYCYDAQDDYTAGTRPVPTPDELIAELPALVW